MKSFKPRLRTRVLKGAANLFYWNGAGAVASGGAAPIGLLFWGVGGALHGLAKLSSRRDRRLGDRLRSQLAGKTMDKVLTLMAKGGDCPVFSLYLRPFTLTGTLNLPNNSLDTSNPFLKMNNMLADQHWDIERLLAEGMERKSLLVGLGLPGEHDGAGRIVVTDEDWQDAVRLLVNTAERIFLLPHASEGTLWEIGHLFQTGAIAKTVWIMPPADIKAKDVDTAGLWAACQKEVHSRFGEKLPDYVPAGGLFMLSGTRWYRKVHGVHWYNTSGLRKRATKLVPAGAKHAINTADAAIARRLAARRGLQLDGAASGKPERRRRIRLIGRKHQVKTHDQTA